MGILPDVEHDRGFASRYAAAGVRCGLSIAETMLAPVGLICDLWAGYQRANDMGQEG